MSISQNEILYYSCRGNTYEIERFKRRSRYDAKLIANLLHIKQNTYSNYENGRREIPIGALIKLAEFYNTSVDYILELTDEQRPYPRKKNI